LLNVHPEHSNNVAAAARIASSILLYHLFNFYFKL
jgi:hypothetical protein